MGTKKHNMRFVDMNNVDVFHDEWSKTDYVRLSDVSKIVDPVRHMARQDLYEKIKYSLLVDDEVALDLADAILTKGRGGV
jgi:hypothetical protein